MALGDGSIAVIDADTHVIEPADLWQTRMSVKKWGDLVPHVKFDPESGGDTWFFGSKPLVPATVTAVAGWHGYPPDHPRTMAELDPHHTDPIARLKRMDEYGIFAEVLYPNLGIFSATEYLGLTVDASFSLECIRAYNDFLIDWCSAAPTRYIPVMTIPFWDLKESIAEMHRAAELGHKGIVMTSRPEHFGLPMIASDHWDTLWAAAQEAQLPVNFHIASGRVEPYANESEKPHTKFGWDSVMGFIGNSRVVLALVFGGVCHRFPGLDFVSVESGVGWLPFMLEAMDWQWKGTGITLDHPEYDLLPSEYFQRQIYGCFWFESGSARAAIDQLGPDNLLYETDYPHPTSMSPGPASPAVSPAQYIRSELGDLPFETQRKLLHDNAARVYHL